MVNFFGKNLKEVMKIISPIFIEPKSTSLTIGISKRFFLFSLIKSLTKKIENDPFLNFVSILKHYKVLGKFLYGNIEEFYRERNKPYFRRFFINKEIYQAIKDDLEWVYERNPNLRLTITKWGVIIYDNYKKNCFNTLLVTIHSGFVMPKEIGNKQTLTRSQRMILEDTDIQKIYSDLVLKKNGIWIDTKLSRFACDYNRSPTRAIYRDGSEDWFGELWKKSLTKSQRNWLLKGYAEFYFTLNHLIDTYRFNLIFDGHSMKDGPNRPGISFGTKYIPKFYMPVVKSMQRRLQRMGYREVVFDKPFSGGHILEWLHKKFPDIFIFSIEINKRLYMNKDQRHSSRIKLKELRNDITQIFDIDEQDFES